MICGARGDILQGFLSVTDLLEEPQLARLYAYLIPEGRGDRPDCDGRSRTCSGNRLQLPQPARRRWRRVNNDEQPRRYAVQEIDLRLTTAASDREYTITLALIDAFGRRETNADIDTYIDRNYVIVSGYVAIPSERSRSREDINVVLESPSKTETTQLVTELKDHGYRAIAIPLDEIQLIFSKDNASASLCSFPHILWFRFYTACIGAFVVVSAHLETLVLILNREFNPVVAGGVSP